MLLVVQENVPGELLRSNNLESIEELGGILFNNNTILLKSMVSESDPEVVSDHMSTWRREIGYT